MSIERYVAQRELRVHGNLRSHQLQHAVKQFTPHLVKTGYVKNFTYMGLPILQYPSDMTVLQELIWRIRPSVIIETGVAYGGSLLFYANLLKQLRTGFVYGVDIDLHPETVQALRNSTLWDRINLIEGSSVDPDIFTTFEWILQVKPTTLVILDSNHTHDHVLAELEMYSDLVSVGSYIVVMDTAVEFYGHLDVDQCRPWRVGDNPWTAVQKFLKRTKRFVIDKEVEQRALITSAPDGWLRRVE